MNFQIMTKPLSVNRCYATKNSVIYTTQDGKTYRAGIRNGLNKHKFDKFQHPQPINVNIHLKLARKRKMDVDNCLKPLLDAMQGIIYDDDSQIYSLSISKTFGHPEDAIHVKADKIPLK